MEFDHVFAEQAAMVAPSFPTDVDLAVSVVLSTGRSAESVLAFRVQNGRLTAVEEPNAEPAITLTVGPKDASAILSGELAVPAAYMQGRLKPAGDNGLWLRMVKATSGGAFEQWRSAIVGGVNR